MNTIQRGEVKEMLHEVLAGYHVKVDAQNTVTNAELGHIKKSLAKLNGTVAEHTKIINDNLPHTILKCSQAKDIQCLKDNMITSKAIKKFIMVSIGITVSIITVIIIIFDFIIKIA